MATEVTMVLAVGTLMANFLTVGARQVFKQDLIYVFCKADLSILFKKEQKKKIGMRASKLIGPFFKIVRVKYGTSNLITQREIPIVLPRPIKIILCR